MTKKDFEIFGEVASETVMTSVDNFYLNCSSMGSSMNIEQVRRYLNKMAKKGVFEKRRQHGKIYFFRNTVTDDKITEEVDNLWNNYHTIFERFFDGEEFEARTVVNNSSINPKIQSRLGNECMACGCHLIDESGRPRGKLHHILMVSMHGSDSLRNTALLCPMCHDGIHIRYNNNKEKIDTFEKAINFFRINLDKVARETRAMYKSAYL